MSKRASYREFVKILCVAGFFFALGWYRANVRFDQFMQKGMNTNYVIPLGVFGGEVADGLCFRADDVSKIRGKQ